MPSKKFLFSDDAHIALLRGISLLAQAVKTTLGPKGRTVMVDRPEQPPAITKDGVSVAKEITLSDPFKNMGALIAREAASKTGDKTGDGTTTAIVLTEALVREGVRHLAAGASARDLKRGIDQAIGCVLTELTRMSQPCRTTQTLRHVARIAAHNDPILGDVIADAVLRAGKEGIVVVGESRRPTTWVEVQEGLRFDGGYLSSSFVTDLDRMTVVLEQPRLLILDRKLDVLHGLIALLDELARQDAPLLVVAPDVTGDALELLTLNKMRGALQVAAVKAPGLGDRRTAFLEDLAVVTGGQVNIGDRGRLLISATAADLGRASRVVINREHTTVTRGQGDQKKIQARIDQVKMQIVRSTSDEETQELRRRLARLAGRAAVIHVGAATDPEVQGKKPVLRMRYRPPRPRWKRDSFQAEDWPSFSVPRCSMRSLPQAINRRE
jgi:chaperonin GroEL